MVKKLTDKYSVEVEYNENTGALISEIRTNRGELHSKFGAAVTRFDPETGNKILEQYYSCGYLYRKDDTGPQEMVWDPVSGICIKECWGSHRSGDKPALTIRSEITGHIILEEYRNHFNLSRKPPHPAVIEYSPDTGLVLVEERYQNGILHGTNERPAIAKYDPDTGVIVREEYWKYGIRHRRRRPAVIYRDGMSGQVILEQYFENGVKNGVGLPAPRP